MVDYENDDIDTYEWSYTSYPPHTALVRVICVVSTVVIAAVIGLGLIVVAAVL